MSFAISFRKFTHAIRGAGDPPPGVNLSALGDLPPSLFEKPLIALVSENHLSGLDSRDSHRVNPTARLSPVTRKVKTL